MKFTLLFNDDRNPLISSQETWVKPHNPFHKCILLYEEILFMALFMVLSSLMAFGNSLHA